MNIIGRKDKIDFPELGLEDIVAKVDTGAYGSALHCHHIEVVVRDGVEMLSFKVLDPSHPEYEDKTFYFDHFNDKRVRSSSGEVEHRYTIKTRVKIFGKLRKLDFSLTDRKEMKHPVLLGRKFLSNHFLVDVHQKDLSHNHKNQVK